MAQHLLFEDPLAAQDAITFARRASSLGDGAVRLQASRGALLMTSAPLAPRGLFDSTPTVLGMRVLAVDAELVCDFVVEAEALSIDSETPTAVVLPETAVAPPWAGVSPPRAGWSEDGTIPASTLAARAQWGIAAVAETVPKDAGEDAVRAVRASIWGPADDALGGLPLGTAFAAFALGFIGGDEHAVVRRAGAWTRITLGRGHVVVRGPARIGLTEVRSTGRS